MQDNQERLTEVGVRIEDIRKAMGSSLGQNALSNLKAELDRLEAEREALSQDEHPE